MKKSILFPLLQSIYLKKDFLALTNIGLRPSQIALILRNAIENEYCGLVNKELVLTQKGQDILLLMKKAYKISSTDLWVQPRFEKKVTPIDKCVIILAKSSEHLVD
jgi:DNA topoisomerase IA